MNKEMLKDEMRAGKEKNDKEWGKNIAVCMIVFVVVFVFFHTVVLWGIVPSSSMEPTLNIGDAVIVN